MNSGKEMVFNECVYAFMVFNKYKITVSRGVWKEEAWKIKGGHKINNCIIDIYQATV